MRYDTIEQAFVTLISPLTLSGGAVLAQMCEAYDGQFEVPFETPESFHPEKRYVLIDMRGCLAESQSTSGSQMKFLGDIAIFVGSEISTRLKAKKEVYEMLDVLRKALHGKKLTSDTSEIQGIKLRFKSDQKEFSTPNHICFSMTFSLELSVRITNA